MSPSTKKFLYGLLYLTLFAVVGFLIFLAVRPANPAPDISGVPSAQIRIQPFDPSAKLRVEKPLLVQDEEVFRLRSVEPAFLFAKVYNPNSEYGALRFSYTFSLFGADGKLLEQVSGQASALPEKETLLSAASINTFSRDVQTVQLSISNVEWAPASQFLEYVFSLPSEPRIEIDDTAKPASAEGSGEAKEMRVVGTVRNETTSRVAEARVIVALRDSFGFRIFVTGTILSNLRSFSNKEFTVSIPYDEDLARQAREGAAEVFFYPVL
ncbi:MAG: hypothetical protein Q8P01_02075 [bacterium]|nr:hypothetical protein [bacterium]